MAEYIVSSIRSSKIKHSLSPSVADRVICVKLMSIEDSIESLQNYSIAIIVPHFLMVQNKSARVQNASRVVRLVAAWRGAKNLAHNLQKSKSADFLPSRFVRDQRKLTTQLPQYRNSTSNLCIKRIDRSSRLERKKSRIR